MGRQEENKGNEKSSTNIENNINSTENERVENSDTSRSDLVEGRNQLAGENTSNISNATALDYKSTTEERNSNNSSNETPSEFSEVASETVNQIQRPNNLNYEENSTQ